MASSNWLKWLERTGKASRSPIRRKGPQTRLAVDRLESRLLPDATGSRFLGAVYGDLFQRPIDTDGLAYWGGLLDHGISRTAVVQGIEASPEYRADQVQQAYGRFLGRAAD